MKKNLSVKLSVFLLSLIYTLFGVGFGVHTCSCSGKSEVHFLLGNIELSKNECEECSHHHHECTHNHEEGCCTTVIVTLVKDQSSYNSFDITFENKDITIIDLFPTDFLSTISFDNYSKIFSIKEPPPLLLNNSFLSLFSQYRV